MDHRIPEPLKALVEQLARLPGLGPKSAMRVAMTLLKWPEAETRRLGKGIHDLRDNLRLCSRCGALTETDPCNVCSDKERDDSLLCVVAEWDSMLTLEEGAFYKGRYLILGGLLAPLDNLSAESLELDRLTKRLEEGQVREVVLALGATVEAETTGARQEPRQPPLPRRDRHPARAGHPARSGSEVHGPRNPAPVAPVPAGNPLRLQCRALAP